LSWDTAESQTGERVSNYDRSPNLKTVTVRQRQPDLVGFLFFDDLFDWCWLKFPLGQRSSAASGE
jgi:hypothetical protein